MNKKTGSPGSLVPPIEPLAAAEAADDKSGEVTEASASPATKQKHSLTSRKYSGSQDNASDPAGGGSAAGSSESSPLTSGPPHQPPATQQEREEKTAWIEIELVGEDDKPIPGLRYRVALPDGSIAEGTLDHRGAARVDGFAPGTCKVSFPDLDRDAWEDA